MSNNLPLGFTFAGVACRHQEDRRERPGADRERPAVQRGGRSSRGTRFPPRRCSTTGRWWPRTRAGLRAVAINAGCANACTGEAGLADAEAMAGLAEAALGLPPRSAAVMSTGVIGPRLPMDKIAAGIQQAAGALSPDGWDAAAHAIMTTDTRPKTAFRADRRRALVRHVQGRGDDPPEHGDHAGDDRHRRDDRARAPGRVAAPGCGRQLQLHQRRRRYEHERHGAPAGERRVRLEAGSWKLKTLSLNLNLSAFASALTSLCTDLAQQIVRDGEGATKFITIRVEGAASAAEARTAAKAVANSPLVKTAFYGGDANWGRILAAVGYSGAVVDPGKADLWIAAGTGRGDLAPTIGACRTTAAVLGRGRQRHLCRAGDHCGRQVGAG